MPCKQIFSHYWKGSITRTANWSPTSPIRRLTRDSEKQTECSRKSDERFVCQATRLNGMVRHTGIWDGTQGSWTVVLATRLLFFSEMDMTPTLFPAGRWLMQTKLCFFHLYCTQEDCTRQLQHELSRLVDNIVYQVPLTECSTTVVLPKIGCKTLILPPNENG